MMKDVLMYAEYNRAGNKTIYGILSVMTAEEREKDRGSFYGSLSGLLRHIMGGTTFFLNMYRGVLGENARAMKVFAALDGVSFPAEGCLDEAGWKELGAVLEIVDSVYVELAEVLGAADMSLLVPIDWYGGNPAAVPLSFLLSQLVMHNTHHRGQISQILDSLKIDNDYSGIEIEFMPK